MLSFRDNRAKMFEKLTLFDMHTELAHTAEYVNFISEVAVMYRK